MKLMNTKKMALMVGLAMMVFSGCAQRTREAKTNISPDQLAQQIQSIESLGSSGTSALTAATNLANKGARLYYAQPGEMGPIHVVAPLDFDFVDTNVGIYGLSDIRIYFYDLPTASGHENALVIEYKPTGAATYSRKAFTNVGHSDLGQGFSQDSDFLTLLRSDQGDVIALRSIDVDQESGDLQDVIQLEVSSIVEGQEVPRGQISSLEGFDLN